MKLKVGKQKRLLVLLIVLTLFSAGLLAYVVFLKDRGPDAGSQEYLTEALNQEETKKNLEEGSCSKDTQDKLHIIDETAEAGLVAKAYETRALCLAFAEESSKAADAYEKAGEFYRKAGDEDTAKVMDSLAENNRTMFPIGPVDNLPEEQSEEGIDYVAE